MALAQPGEARFAKRRGSTTSGLYSTRYVKPVSTRAVRVKAKKKSMEFVVKDEELFYGKIPIFSDRHDEIDVFRYSILRKNRPASKFRTKRCLFIHGLQGDKWGTDVYDYWGDPFDPKSIFNRMSCYEIWYVRYPTLHIVDAWANPNMQRAIAALVRKFSYNPCNPTETKIFAHSMGNIYLTAAIANNRFKTDGGRCWYGSPRHAFLPTGLNQSGYRMAFMDKKGRDTKTGKTICNGPRFYSIMGPWQGTAMADNQYQLCSESTNRFKRFLAAKILKLCASPYSITCKKGEPCKLGNLSQGYLGRSLTRKVLTAGNRLEPYRSPMRPKDLEASVNPDPSVFATGKEKKSIQFFDWGFLGSSTVLPQFRSGWLARVGYQYAVAVMCGTTNRGQSWLPNKGWMYPLANYAADPSSIFGGRNDGIVTLKSCMGIGWDQAALKPLHWTSKYHRKAKYYKVHVNHYDGAGRSPKIKCETHGDECVNQWYVDHSRDTVHRQLHRSGDLRCTETPSDIKQGWRDLKQAFARIAGIDYPSVLNDEAARDYHRR
eukprot:TRINITY_DN2408_c1_g1_i1.p1 TRINITY_DN2408_c1_g1~~TRINITY_DN2408_c1_g1_i1.p1  ORF type:complete len:545 (-),score=84.81 TRINITY_DN2408_c1_g1_i1:281-1915(-)